MQCNYMNTLVLWNHFLKFSIFFLFFRCLRWMQTQHYIQCNTHFLSPPPNLNHTVHCVTKFGREYSGQNTSQKQNKRQEMVYYNGGVRCLPQWKKERSWSSIAAYDFSQAIKESPCCVSASPWGYSTSAPSSRPEPL